MREKAPVVLLLEGVCPFQLLDAVCFVGRGPPTAPPECTSLVPPPPLRSGSGSAGAPRPAERPRASPWSCSHLDGEPPVVRLPSFLFCFASSFLLFLHFLLSASCSWQFAQDGTEGLRERAACTWKRLLVCLESLSECNACFVGSNSAVGQ